MPEPPDSGAGRRAFEAEGARRVGFAREMFDFLRANKKWWQVPIVVTVVLAGLLLLLSGTAAAPFIYTLF